MNRNNKAFYFAALYAFMVTILFGAVLFETLIVYPNIFHDLPTSLETAKQFAVIAGPHDFFPPFGLATIVAGILATTFSWKISKVRTLLIASLLLIVVFEFLFSMFFFWRRNTILFDEGLAMHSVEHLKLVARQFQTGHWIRLTMCGLGSVLSFAGLVTLPGQQA